MRTICVGLLALFIVTTTQSVFGWQTISCLTRGSRTVCYTTEPHQRETNDDAAAVCGRRHPNGGRLAAILNVDVQRALSTILGHNAYWIGARLKRLLRWTWTDGSSDVSWLSINGSSSGRYVKLIVEAGTYQANLIPSFDSWQTSSENATCRRRACEDIHGDCYFVKKAHSWHDARNKCLLDGGDLATLSNSSFEELRNRRIIGPGYYFVGLRNAIFEWQGTLDEVKYTDWSSVSDDHECVLLRTDLVGRGQWFTEYCDQRRLFVCEYEVSTSDVPSPRSPPSHASPELSIHSPAAQCIATRPQVIGLGILSTCLFAILVVMVAHRLYEYRKKQNLAGNNTRTAQQTERYEQIAVDNRTVADNTLMYARIRVVDNTTYINVSQEHKSN